MIKVPVYNLDKKEVNAIEVPSGLFGVKWNADLVHQALITQKANSRNVIAHAKGRGEVRGGGKKPWKQKGTGRSRHGSIRSPLWSGGGITFGPNKERIFERKINKKMNQKAIFSSLSDKFKKNRVMVVETFSKTISKTKDFGKLVKNILTPKETTTFIFSDKNKNSYKGARNISKVFHLSPKSLNVYDITRPKKIIIEKDAIDEIIAHYKLVK
ncbi:MAG TPA: 50S ribosomal protein L4 [Candidatus Paceibacterota bacterium]|nr:50S ribosomal protein L4 [Candidatus Paceibacterota bacterium]